MPRASDRRDGSDRAARAKGRAVAGAGAAAMVTVVGALLWASTAFACTNLATISLSAGYGHVGDTITIIGTSFPVPRASSTVPATPATPVVVHWKSSDGPILATVTPDRTGTISATITIPPTEPGNVAIVALQRRAIIDPATPDGPPKSFIDEAGTPARTTFRILAPAEPAPTSVPFTQFVSAGGDDGSTGLIVLMILFGTVAMSLFAGGVIAFLHQIRSQRPVPQQWPPW